MIKLVDQIDKHHMITPEALLLAEVKIKNMLDSELEAMFLDMDLGFCDQWFDCEGCSGEDTIKKHGLIGCIPVCNQIVKEMHIRGMFGTKK